MCFDFLSANDVVVLYDIVFVIDMYDDLMLHFFVMCFVAKLFFFGTITAPNLLFLCFCPQLQVSNFIVWARFLPALVRVCFCFGCVGMVAGPALICYVFCCEIIFFWNMYYS